MNLTLPVASGEPAVGQVLTCAPGTWAGNVTSRAYRWLRDGAPISGATASAYTLIGADDGHVIRCRETATNTAGSASADSAGVNAYGTPTNLTAPALTGEAGIGLDLTCVPGTWSGRVDTTSYAWLRDGTPIASATGISYTVAAADDGHAIACRQTVTNPAGSSSATSATLNGYAAATVATPPTLSGTPAVGSNLTCTPGIWTGRVDSTSFAWLRDGSTIAGETSSTYTVVAADAGHNIGCRILATNPAGTAAADSATVSAYDAPELTSAPTISGTPFAGQTLTCDPASWRYPVASRSYLWTKDGSPIAGATSAIYTVQVGDLDGAIRCRETATNATGATSATSSPTTVYAAPQLLTPAGISGTPGVGQTLTCLPGDWQYPVASRSYEWLSDGSPIGGAASSTYVVAAVDAGHFVSCRETATNPAGSQTTTSGQLSAFGRPVVTTSPAVAGDPAVGSTLSCSAATWAAAPTVSSIARTWLRDGVAIAAETGATHVVVSADAGHLISCRDTASNGAGPTPATSSTLSAYDAPLIVVAPFLVGEPVAGQIVTCNTGTFQYPTPTRFIEWLRDGGVVSGATGPTFVISTLDSGHGIRCRVTAINNAGSTQVRSAQVTAYDKPVNTAAPSVTGTPAVGQALSCVAGSWQYPVVSSSVQWLRDGVVISGATGSTYTLQTADGGHQISCRETATNAGGSTSEDSDQIAAYDKPAPRSPPRVAGQTAVGQTLTCESGTWANPVITRSYEWLRDGSLTAMATGRTYVITADDGGHYIRCRERASNDAGVAAATSAAIVTDLAGGSSTPGAVTPVTAPEASAKPSIQGQRLVGGVVTCEGGRWTGNPTIAYRWLRGSAVINGATAATYTLTAADSPSGVRCEVTATNEAGRTTLTVATGTIAGQTQVAIRTDDIPNAMVLTVGGVRVVLPRSLSRGSLKRTKLIRYRIYSTGAANVSVRIGGRTIVTKLTKGGTTPRLTLKVASRVTAKLTKLSYRIEVTAAGPKAKRTGHLAIKGRAKAK